MTAATGLKPFLAKIADGASLSADDAAAAFDIIMSGAATASQIGGFLMALRVRGETVDEITGAARIMRSKMLPLVAPPAAVDCVGTGGDGGGTYNISTAASLVVAGCGVPVAKHGNKAMSSRSGAADVLTTLGVNYDAPIPDLEEALRSAGICFMMAQRHHGAMRHVGPTRVELGTRTIFNLVGPLSNPVGVDRQLVGVFAERWVRPVAETLAALGSVRAWVVHGSDGLDEITTTGPTHVSALEDGNIRSFVITPEEAGLPIAAPADLKGGDPAENARALRAVLDGAQGPYRDIVLLNAAATLIVAGKAEDLRAGVQLAAASIDGGAARSALDRLVAVTNRSSEEGNVGV